MRNSILALSLTLTLCAASAVNAQNGMVTNIGTGCTTPRGVPTMNNNGVPRIGGSFDLFYTGPNNQIDSTQQIAQPHLIIGFGNFGGPVPIPTTLLPFQPANCELFVNHNIVIPMAPDQNGRNAFQNSQTLSIGNDPALIGTTFFAQWMTINTQCGFAGCNAPLDWTWIGMSDSAACFIGA